MNGKGQGVRQVEDVQSQSGQSVIAPSAASTSASAYRTPSSVQRVEAVQEAALNTPPGCRQTLIFDISEVDCDPCDCETFGLPSVMVVKGVAQ